MEIMTAAERIELMHLRSIGVAEQDSTKCLGHNVRLIGGIDSPFNLVGLYLVIVPISIHCKYFDRVPPLWFIYPCRIYLDTT